MPNPFATIAEKEKKGGNTESGGGGGKKKANKGVNIANLIAEEEAPKKKQGQQQQQQQSQRGFKVVEAPKPKERKPKPTAAEVQQQQQQQAQASAAAVDFSDKAQAWAYYREQEEREAKKQADLERLTKKKWGGGPVGAKVIDPAIEKAEKKAAAALRKQVARQTVKVKSGGAYTELVERSNANDDDEGEDRRPAVLQVVAEEKPAKKAKAGGKKAAPANDDDGASGHGKQWRLLSGESKKDAPASPTVYAAVFVDPNEALDGMADASERVAAKKPKKTKAKPQQQQQQQQQNSNDNDRRKDDPADKPPPPRGKVLNAAAASSSHQHHQASATADASTYDTGMGDRAASTNSSPSTPMKPVKAANSALAKLEKQSANNHQHEADGSVRALVRFVFVLENGALLTVGGPGLTAEEQKSVPMAPKIIANQLVKKRPVKGGYFITVEGKHFVDQTIVDEPWMSETFLKALVAVLKDQDSPATATPGYAAAQGVQSSEMLDEHEIVLHLMYGTALEMKHVMEHKRGALRVPMHECRVSLKPFIKDIILQAKLLEKAVEATREAVATAVPDERQRDSLLMALPRKTAEIRAQLEAAATSHFRSEAGDNDE